MLNEVVKAGPLSLRDRWLKESGEVMPAHICPLKRNNCQMSLDVARSARTAMGANGVTGEYGVLRHAFNLESTHT